MSGLGVTHQSLVRVILHCRKCDKLIVYFFDFFFKFIGIFLEFFNFVSKIPCGCWTISKMPMGVGAGDVIQMMGFMGAILCGWRTILMM